MILVRGVMEVWICLTGSFLVGQGLFSSSLSQSHFRISKKGDITTYHFKGIYLYAMGGYQLFWVEMDGKGYRKGESTCVEGLMI